MKTVLFWITAAITMVISVCIALIYFRLAMTLIPQAFLSSFNKAASSSAFIFWGIMLGLVMVAIEALLFWLLPKMVRKSPSA